MGTNDLGRVLDPDALEASSGARARISIEVPGDWLAAPCEIMVVLPRRLVCARCEGGGCDGCGRSGALRAPGEDEARTIRVHLGPTSPGVAIRIGSPFGAEIAIDQLILVVERGESPSPGVTRRAAAPALAHLRRPPAWPGLLLIALAATAAILLSLFGR